MKEFPKFVKYRFREFGLFLPSKKKTDERTINNRNLAIASLLGTSVCDRPVSKKSIEKLFSQRKQHYRISSLF